MRTRTSALLLAVLLLAAGACSPTPQPAGDGAGGARGVVASPEAHAAEVGAEILRAGGNAVDAAIAVHFALAVSNPFAGNIGGGGFFVIHAPGRDDGDVFALDFREAAPSAASRDMYLDEDGEVIPAMSLYTHSAAGVPGSVAGLWAAHERFATLPWETLVEPAVRLAEEGFVLDEWTAASIERVAARHAALGEDRRLHIDFLDYFRGAAGERLVQPELAATLGRIARDGPDDFYRGETARLIADEMRRGGGLITLADLDAYRPRWRAPIEGSYRGHRIVSMPPPSSGGIALLQMLGMLEGFEMPERETALRLHLFAEVEKRAFADRTEYLGDPDFFDVPVLELLEPEYVRRRASDISLDRRTEPSAIRSGELHAGALLPAETTHFSVVDAQGMAVSCTTTLNSGYGSGIVVDGAGFLLNNEMDDFSSKPGAPNQFGVTGGEANAIAPGKRMLSSMTPTLVFRPGGEFWMALGSPGGPTIFTTVLQVLVARIDDGMTLAQAIDAPRFHHQWPPLAPPADPIIVEAANGYALPAPLLGEIRAFGYTIEERDTLGDVQAVSIDEGRSSGHSDARRTGSVAYE